MPILRRGSVLHPVQRPGISLVRFPCSWRSCAGWEISVIASSGADPLATWNGGQSGTKEVDDVLGGLYAV